AVARWGAPFYHLHRADLHDVLRTALGEQHLTLGARCVAVEPRAAGVEVLFADGRGATGELLVGADGIHSMGRDHVAGPARPIWWGQGAWRGARSADLVAPGRVARAGARGGRACERDGGAAPLLLGAPQAIRGLFRRGRPPGELGRQRPERRRL